MIKASHLRKLARDRLRDAKVLFRAGRYDAVWYIAGYAVELALKHRICRTLNWSEFPMTLSEFQRLQSFKTHDLEILLRLSGQQGRINAQATPEWTVVSKWNPEVRYQQTTPTSQSDAEKMLRAVQIIVRAL
jgi:HEPN domain-containing protein